jgi:3-oxoacid CoA-transferase subunit A
MKKLYPSAAAALQGVVADGQLLAVGGFGLCGIPEALIDALRDSGVKTDHGVQQRRRGRLWPGQAAGNPPDQEDDRQLCGREQGVRAPVPGRRAGAGVHPQGTLAEKMRAGGAGIPAFFTKTGVGTLVAEGKELREFDGETYVMERAIVADVSLVKAWRADKSGNLQFRLTARNFNPAAATCGKVCIVEVEELVEVGEIAPDDIHLPGIYVHRIVHNAHPEKRIEKRTVREA